mgnify:FL=1
MEKKTETNTRKNSSVRKFPKVSWIVYVARFITYLPMRIIFPIKIIGCRKLQKGKLVIAMNHKSGWDPVIVVHRFAPPIHFIAKTEFQTNKVLSWLMKLTGVIFIRRGEADFSAAKSILNVLERNHRLGLFPEGTRHPHNDGKLGAFKMGVAYYAIKEKSAVQPIIIDKKIRFFRKNTLYVGEPFELSQFYDKPLTNEILTEANAVIYAKMQDMRDELNIISAQGNT